MKFAACFYVRDEYSELIVSGDWTCISSANPVGGVNLVFVLVIYTKCCFANRFGVFALPFQDIGNILPVYTAQCPRRVKTTTVLQQLPKIL